jgi:hypothetical protein
MGSCALSCRDESVSNEASNFASFSTGAGSIMADETCLEVLLRLPRFFGFRWIQKGEIANCFQYIGQNTGEANLNIMLEAVTLEEALMLEALEAIKSLLFKGNLSLQQLNKLMID